MLNHKRMKLFPSVFSGNEGCSLAILGVKVVALEAKSRRTLRESNWGYNNFEEENMQVWKVMYSLVMLTCVLPPYMLCFDLAPYRLRPLIEEPTLRLGLPSNMIGFGFRVADHSIIKPKNMLVFANN